MASFTLEEVMTATGSRLLYTADPQVCFPDVSTDTRSIGRGSLFIALKGENFDGHDYVTQAVEHGATGIIVQEDRVEYHREGLAVFLVADTLAAYQGLARFHRRRFSIPVIAVTGSVGKTTTRSMIASVLAQKFNVLQTEKNFNNEIGLPKTLLQLTPEHGACVVEMGMRGRGQIAALAAIAEPTIGVVTNVGNCHIELLGSKDNIAKAKSELVEAISTDGVAVLNQDDPYTAAMADLCRGKVIGYGLTGAAMIEGSRVRLDESGIRFKCRCFDELFDVHVPVIGAHNVQNALAAIAVGRVLGICGRKLQNGLAEYKGFPMRQELLHIAPYTFINDTYNANPASMAEALHVLAQFSKGQKIAVLGDMLELGDWARQEHEKVGKEAAELGVDVLITLGPLAGYIAESARQNGMQRVYSVPDHAAAAAQLQKILKPGDTILLKGSRGMAMENILPYFERK
jgi:UDP-N-acetylmuramoyl-tripeptide--D-alanyl-D-alanine ligase